MALTVTTVMYIGMGVTAVGVVTGNKDMTMVGGVLMGGAGIAGGMAAMGTAATTTQMLSAGAQIVGGAAQVVGGLTGNSSLVAAGGALNSIGAIGTSLSGNAGAASSSASSASDGAATGGIGSNSPLLKNTTDPLAANYQPLTNSEAAGIDMAGSNFQRDTGLMGGSMTNNAQAAAQTATPPAAKTPAPGDNKSLLDSISQYKEILGGLQKGFDSYQQNKIAQKQLDISQQNATQNQQLLNAKLASGNTALSLPMAPAPFAPVQPITPRQPVGLLGV